MKVDARIEGNCGCTISYLQGYSCPKLQLQETEQSETYSECSSQYKKKNFMLNAGQDKRISIYQTYFIFVPLFSKPILTREITLSTKNSQKVLASQVSVLRRNKATNSSTSNCPFFSCTESPCHLVFYSRFLDLTSHSHGKFNCHLEIKMKKI